jgi:hypothetical protein
VKRKFGAALRSKTRVGQENELLAKLLCFNLSVLVHEMYELGIVATFWPGQKMTTQATAKVLQFPPAR